MGEVFDPKLTGSATQDPWILQPQPLYANAPPKPKRQNARLDVSCSSESFIDNTHVEQHRDTKRPELSNSRISVVNNSNSSERRTPDVYGAAANSTHDYEEMHEFLHRKENSQTPNNIHESCTTNHLHNASKVSDEFAELDSFRVIDKSANHRSVRPQSADILDFKRTRMSYDSGFSNDNETNSPARIRSQSSMGQDIDHWSEENYAQKMRQSSLYHSKNLALSHGRSSSSIGARVPPAGAATPDLYTTSPVYHQRTLPELREQRVPYIVNSAVTNGTRDQQNVPQYPVEVNGGSHNSTLNASFTDASFSRSSSVRAPGGGSRKDDSLSSSFAQDPEEMDEKKIHLVSHLFVHLGRYPYIHV